MSIMNPQDKEGSLSLMEAVETLTSIAEMPLNLEMPEQGDTKPHRSINWLKQYTEVETVEMVKSLFNVVLNHLKSIYQKDYTQVSDSKTLDGIRSLMSLVTEAAKKIDAYSQIFHKDRLKSVTQLKEYQQLQEFYSRKISPAFDENVLGKWILSLSQSTLSKVAWKKNNVKWVSRKNPESEHLFVDLEAVKNDTEYELFFIRKEDNTRFFNPSLLRNIKLVGNFGNYLKSEKEKESFADLSKLKERMVMLSAKRILAAVQENMHSFYSEAITSKDIPLVALVNKTLMALMLASYSKHLNSEEDFKTCSEYFKDFQFYLRESCHSSYYKKLVNQQNGETSLEPILLKTIHGLCKAVFLANDSLKEFGSFVSFLKEEALPETEFPAPQNLTSSIVAYYNAIDKLYNGTPSGSINLIIRHIEEGNYNAFDPYFQGNIPHVLYSLTNGDKKVDCIRIPAPLRQEHIQTAEVIPEFQAFLKACEEGKEKFLLINLQDRTSWKEKARSNVLEDLGNISDCLSIASIAKETEFYHQLPPYRDNHQSDVFIKHLKEHFAKEESGYYFSNEVKKQLSSAWLDGVIKGIHQFFFYKKNVLTKEQRLNFIEILDLFIILKLIEQSQADYFSLICKDGIDLSNAQNALLFSFFKLLSTDFNGDDIHVLDAILYGPPLLNRERVLLREKFTRMVNALRTMENVREELGTENYPKRIEDTFGIFYPSKILEWYAQEIKALP